MAQEGSLAKDPRVLGGASYDGVPLTFAPSLPLPNSWCCPPLLVSNGYYGRPSGSKHPPGLLANQNQSVSQSILYTACQLKALPLRPERGAWY